MATLGAIEVAHRNQPAATHLVLSIEGTTYDETQSRDVGNRNSFFGCDFSLGPNHYGTRRRGNTTPRAHGNRALGNATHHGIAHATTRPDDDRSRARRNRRPQTGTPRGGATGGTALATNVDETPVVTHHKIDIDGKTLEYTVTVAQMPIKDNSGDTEAHICFFAYTLDHAEPTKRPLTFAFNGGPGSASIWVHMGAMGPRKVVLTEHGDMPPPPFGLIDNPNTWLDQTDLVLSIQCAPVTAAPRQRKSPAA